MGVTIAGIAIATIISAISGYMGAKAQKEAYEAIAKATNEEKEMLQQEYDKAYGEGSYNSQIQNIGLNASQNIESLLADQDKWDKYVSGENAWKDGEDFSFTAEDLYGDPSYKVRLNEGLDALEQSLVAGGNADSGYAQKAINNYAQEQASKEYANAYNRAYTNYRDEKNFDYNAWKNEANQYYQNLQNQLAGLQGLSAQGQQANTNQTNALMTLAGQKANAGIQAATANAAANQSQTGQYTSVLDSVGSGIMAGVGAYGAYNGNNYNNSNNSSSNGNVVSNTTPITNSNNNGYNVPSYEELFGRSMASYVNPTTTNDVGA